MSQIIHIFRKDVRHHWPEILLSLSLLVTFAIQQPREWTHQTIDSRFLTALINYLPGIMALSWVFLILRLVQGEPLVGDRLFWITRPYEWPKLLAAKLLSIALFIHLPLFVSQLILLKVASFPVISSIPGLLFMHVLIAMAFVLPSLTLGCITSGIGQSALTLLAALLLLAGLAALVFFVLPEADLADETDTLNLFLYVGACLTAVLVQYVYRKTVLARLIVTAASALGILIVLLTPYNKLINHELPLPTPAHPLPLHLTLDRGLSFDHPDGRRSSPNVDEVELEIPFKFSDLSEKSIVQVRAIKLELEFPDGTRWSSHWRRNYDSVSYGRTRVWLTIGIKRALFERFRDDQVKAHMSFGYNVYRTGDSTRVLVAGDRLAIPGGGRCLNHISDIGLRCFAALKEPGPFFVLAELPNAACPVSEEFLAEGLAPSPASYSSLSFDSTPNLGFSPIEDFSISLTRYYLFEDRQIRLPICPGTSLFISKPQFLYPVRDEVDLGEVTLLNYLPTYPRRIVPPREHLSPGTPSNSLSLNSAPRGLRPEPI